MQAWIARQGDVVNPYVGPDSQVPYELAGGCPYCREETSHRLMQPGMRE